MFLALVESRLELAREGIAAQCPQCHEEVIPKCGDIVRWHWAHHADSKCPYVGGTYTETMWHRQWKSYADPANTEVTVIRDGNTHRADIIVRGDPDICCEVQYSQISPNDIESRTQFWQDIRWIFHAADKGYRVEYAEDWGSRPGFTPVTIHRGRDWPQIVVAYAGKPAYSEQSKSAVGMRAGVGLALDLGEGEVFIVHKMNRKGTWLAGNIVRAEEVGEWIAGTKPWPAVPVGARRVSTPRAFTYTSSGDRAGAVYEKTGDCPLCNADHDSCRFAAGSLYCVKTDCTNPHHRKAAT